MKTRIVMAGLILVILTASAAFFTPVFGTSPVSLKAKGKGVDMLGVLEGFEPGAKVTYNVFPEAGKAASGSGVVGMDGALKLPGYNLNQASGRLLSYDLKIEEKASPLNVTVTFDAVTGKIAVLSKGLPKFSEMDFKGAASDLQTKADWAGIVKTAEAGKLDDIGHEGGFRIALMGDIMSDAPKQNPKVIQILSAPGGGMFNDPQLNQYDTSTYGCNDGISPGPDYSYCESDFDDAIQDIIDNYVTALYLMGEQLTAVMGMQMLPIGAMIDAKQQLEVQLEIQRLRAEAHKDYQPSTTMCEFGSFMKSITSADDKAVFEKQAISNILMDYYSGLEHVASGEGPPSDIPSRLLQFRTVYCDPNDNNDGLHYICDHDGTGPGTAEGAGAANRARINKDVDYTRTMDMPLTLDLDFAYAHTTGTNTRASTPDEQDILALGKNLYWATPFSPGFPEGLAENYSNYENARSFYAMMGVAHNSFATLAGMKSKTVPGLGANSGWSYMKSMMRDFGLSDPDINALLGEFPSYYAQMEVLTKKIYQRPDFFTSLYDKPVNVKRIGVTMDAIEIMQQRDFFESALRREMLTSLLVEQALEKHVDRINGGVLSDIKNLQ